MGARAARSPAARAARTDDPALSPDRGARIRSVFALRFPEPFFRASRGALARLHAAPVARAEPAGAGRLAARQRRRGHFRRRLPRQPRARGAVARVVRHSRDRLHRERPGRPGARLLVGRARADRAAAAVAAARSRAGHRRAPPPPGGPPRPPLPPAPPPLPRPLSPPP